MDWPEALDFLVSRTGVERYRALCAESWPDHAAYRDFVIAEACRLRSPWLLAPRVEATLASETPPAAGDCGCGGRA